MQPKPGDAIIVHNLGPDSAFRTASMYVGCGVLGGARWVLTQWVGALPHNHTASEAAYWDEAHADLAGGRGGEGGFLAPAPAGGEGGEDEMMARCVDASEFCVDWTLAGDCDESERVRAGCCRSCSLYDELWIPMLTNF